MSSFSAIYELLRPKADQAKVIVIEYDSPICPLLIGLLNDHERDQCNRYIYQPDRFAAGVMRGLLRLGAGALTETMPRSVSIVRDHFGRPSIQGLDRTEQDINVSRTKTCCAMVLSCGGRCGVDIEQIDPAIIDKDLLKVLGGNSDEISKFAQNPDKFFIRWTQTEAALKADGRGLKSGLEAVEWLSESINDRKQCRIGQITWGVELIQTPSGIVGSCALSSGMMRVSQIGQREIESLDLQRILCASDD